VQGKTNLASDLLWLAKAGHVIEFSDGTLDLPLSPKAPEQKGPTESLSPVVPAATGSAVPKEEANLATVEPESLTEPASTEEADIEEQTFETQSVIETEPGREQPDQEPGRSAPGIKDEHQPESQSSAQEPRPSEGLTAETENNEPNPPTDSPEERREWVAAGP
jgi:hypothetical protein